MTTIGYRSDAGPRNRCHVTHIYHALVSPNAVPMALESVHAGFPSVAQDYFSGDFSFDQQLIEHPDTTFIITVAGDSMQGAGIWDGDLLLVDRSLSPQPDDVVIAVLDGELTIKRLLWRGSGPILHPENPQYPDFRPGPDEDLMIWGVVMGNFHWQRRETRHNPTPRHPHGAVSRDDVATERHDAQSHPKSKMAPHREPVHPQSSIIRFGKDRYPNHGWSQ